jgi:hypothetical protein
MKDLIGYRIFSALGAARIKLTVADDEYNGSHDFIKRKKCLNFKYFPRYLFLKAVYYPP